MGPAEWQKQRRVRGVSRAGLREIGDGITGAHAPRVLVLAPRQNNLSFRTSSRSRGAIARTRWRVRSPDGRGYEGQFSLSKRGMLCMVGLRNPIMEAPALTTAAETPRHSGTATPKRFCRLLTTPS